MYAPKMGIPPFLFWGRQTRVSSFEGSNLLVILIAVLRDDVEEAELVDTLGGGDDAEPVTELLLLQELLGAVVGEVVSH